MAKRMDKITRANDAITKLGILEKLHEFNATVVSTIHAQLDIESSDIDIICSYHEQSEFIRCVAALRLSNKTDSNTIV